MQYPQDSENRLGPEDRLDPELKRHVDFYTEGHQDGYRDGRNDTIQALAMKESVLGSDPDARAYIQGYAEGAQKAADERNEEIVALQFHKEPEDPREDGDPPGHCVEMEHIQTLTGNDRTIKVYQCPVCWRKHNL